MIITPETIIKFWFNEITPGDWFKKSEKFDQQIRQRFSGIYDAATHNELFDWRDTAEGCLAEVIVLDQFSRNMFRDSAKAFQFDSLAVALTQSAIIRKLDITLPDNKRKFLYMPLMHSESLVVHDQAMQVFSQEGLEDNYQYEVRHREIILKFGRYPHRNKILGRESTTEEKVFLKQPGSSF
jgi:uncharacterized protein (DUF924 family)